MLLAAFRFIFPEEYPNENDDENENRDVGLIFNFDFVETAMLVTCINKFQHTRLLAVFNSQFSIDCLPCQGKIKIVYSVEMVLNGQKSTSATHAHRKSEPFDKINLFVCFPKRKALAELFSLSDLLRLDLHFLKSVCRRALV